MTKRDFFRLVIKIFGLFWLISTVFQVVPSNLGYIIESAEVSSVAWVLFSAAVVFIVFYWLIMRADFVIDLMNLDKGFDNDQMEMVNFTPKSIARLAMIIIGGIMIVDHIPTFLMHILYALEEDITGYALRPEGNFYWAISGINVVVGFLLIRNSSWIEKLLVKTREVKSDS